MTEHDLHEPLRRLAQTAPAPAPGLAGDVVERGRTARRRRLGAVTVAGAAAVAALVVLVPLLGTGDADQGAEPVASDPTTSTEPPPSPEPSDRMQVAAAGMRALLRENYPSEGRLWVRDSVCARWNDFTDDSGECTDLVAADRTELERLLPIYSIAWVEDGRRPDGSHYPGGFGKPHPPYVEVSELQDVSAEGGSVFVWVIRDGLDCAGGRYSVTLNRGSAPDAVQGEVQVVC